MNTDASTARPDPCPTNVQPLGVAELRARFSSLGPRRARGLLKKMRHVEAGGCLYTTEAWLAEYVAAHAVMPRDWPDPGRDREPVDADVIQRAVELLGALAGQGYIAVLKIS